MSMRAKFIPGVVLLAIALAVWRIVSPPAKVTLVESPETVAVETPGASTRPVPVLPVPRESAASQSRPADPQPAEPVANPSALDERTLVGTKWERDGFSLEFGADGRLLIGGRERAQWRIEGSRIRLYRDATGEEHWLDIVGSKLMWEGQEIPRAR